MVIWGKTALTIILKFAIFVCCCASHICHHQIPIEPIYFPISPVHVALALIPSS
jgi:hypothetical protein